MVETLNQVQLNFSNQYKFNLSFNKIIVMIPRIYNILILDRRKYKTFSNLTQWNNVSEKICKSLFAYF